MFRFADPNFLYLLILLPFLVALYLYSNYHRRQNIRKYGDPALLKGLMPTISKYRPDIKFWLTFAALTLVILMLARPQFGSKMETVKRSGVEAVIALGFRMKGYKCQLFRQWVARQLSTVNNQNQMAFIIQMCNSGVKN